MTTSEWQVSDSTSEIRRLTHALLGYFTNRLPEHEDPRDYVTDVWLAAGRGFRRESSLHHYVFQIARRLVASHWRRANRAAIEPLPAGPDSDLPLDGPGCETLLELVGNSESVALALPLVRQPYRDAVQLWLAGRDAMQIADMLGIKYHTARSRIVRGRRLLISEIRKSRRPPR